MIVRVVDYCKKSFKKEAAAYLFFLRFCSSLLRCTLKNIFLQNLLQMRL